MKSLFETVVLVALLVGLGMLAPKAFISQASALTVIQSNQVVK